MQSNNSTPSSPQPDRHIHLHQQQASPSQLRTIRKSPSGRKLPSSPPPLPDPSLFPDPYPSGFTTTPPVSLFSAGTSSARSSAYASPGSALRSSVASSDGSGHRHQAMPLAAAVAYGGGLDSAQYYPAPTQTQNSHIQYQNISSNSQMSSGQVQNLYGYDDHQLPYTMEEAPYSPGSYEGEEAPGSASGVGVATTADDIVGAGAEPVPLTISRGIRSNSRPGSRPSTLAEQTRWSSSSNTDDVGNSGAGSKTSSWGNFNPVQLDDKRLSVRSSGAGYDGWNKNIDVVQEKEESGFLDTTDDERYDEEDIDDMDRTAAVVLAETGQGFIVKGEGMDVQELDVPTGTTHLLLNASASPNQVPLFLATHLPSISNTLLALDISANFLPSLSPALASCLCLEELNVSGNPIRVLPTWIGGLTGLRVLIVDGTSLSNLPTSLSGLVHLHTLSIRRNRFFALPSWLCLLPALEALYVDGNTFQGPWRALLEPLVFKPRPETLVKSALYPPNTPHTAVSMASSDVSPESEYSNEEAGNGDGNAPGLQPPSSSSNLGAEQNNQLGPGNYDDRTLTLGNTDGAGHTPAAPYPAVTAPWNSNISSSDNQQSNWHRDSIAAYPGPPPTSRPQTPGLTRSRHVKAGPRPSTTHSTSSTRTDQELPERPLSRTKTAPTKRVSRPLSSVDNQGPAQSNALGGVTEETKLQSTPFDYDDTTPNMRRMKSAGDIKRAASKSLHEASLQGSPIRMATAPAESSDMTGYPGKSMTVGPRSGASREAYKSLTNTMFESPNKGNDGPGLPAAYGAKDYPSDKEKGGKWGFLKKMSMGKMKHGQGQSGDSHYRLGPPRPMINATQSTSSVYQLASNSRSTTSLHTNSQGQQRKVLVKKQSSGTLASVAMAVTSTPSGPSPALTIVPPQNIHSGLFTGAVSTPSFLAPPGAAQPNSTPVPASPRGTKRRSFLPVHSASPLSIVPPPNSNGIIVIDGSQDTQDSPANASPQAIISPSSPVDYDEEKQRERHTRALRSVMAYLRDLCDLNAQTSQGAAAVQAAAAKAKATAMGVNLPSGTTTPERPSTVHETRSRRPTLAGAEPPAGTTTSMFSSSSSSPPYNSANSTFDMTQSMSSLDGAASELRKSTGSLGAGLVEEKKYKDDKSKRAMIIREIVTTERTYVKGLQELVDIYVTPATVPATVIANVASKETIVPAAERKIVFNGLESLLQFHKASFLPALEKAYQTLEKSDDADGETSYDVALKLARVFVSHAAFMRMYSTYINNFDNSVQRVKNWTDKPSSAAPSAAASTTALPATAAAQNTSKEGDILSSSQRKRIKQYLKKCRIHPRHSQLNLEGYLLLPVQRIPRYRLLLEELVRATPPKPTALDDPLDRALNEITSLASNMNEGKRESESRRKLVQWQARIRGKFPSPLVQPHRRLIMDGRLQLTRVVRKISHYFEIVNSDGDKALISVECLAPEVTPRALVAILCNDLLVLCKDPSGGVDNNGPVDLWAVLRMQTVPQPASIIHGNALRLVDNKAILYFEISTASDALTWARAINMHIPTATK